MNKFRIFLRALIIVNLLLTHMVGVTMMGVAKTMLPENTQLPMLILGATMIVEIIFVIMFWSTFHSPTRQQPDTAYKSLADKMMACPLRLQYGIEHCAKCPEGYVCASGKYGGK